MGPIEPDYICILLVGEYFLQSKFKSYTNGQIYTLVADNKKKKMELNNNLNQEGIREEKKAYEL